MKSGIEGKILLWNLFLGSISTGFAEFSAGEMQENFGKVVPHHYIYDGLSTNKLARIEKSLSYDAWRGDVSVSFPTYRVERQAFQRNDVSQITIPEGVTFIDQLAFADCSNLDSISFPSTLQDIEDSFVDCTNLLSVDLSPSAQLQCLNGSFQGCTGLTSVTLPESLEEIGESTFEGCTNLASFHEIPSYRFIGNQAFKGTNLTRTPLLSKVEHIGADVFDTGKPILWDFGEFSWVDDPGQSDEDLFVTYSEATGIRANDKLRLSLSINRVNDKTFSSLPWQDEIQILSLSPAIQDVESLKGLVKLKNLEIPERYRLSNVSNTIFDNCPDLEEVPYFVLSREDDGVLRTTPIDDRSIQNALVLYGAQVLSEGTFQNCENLTIVRFPDSLETIGFDVFADCPLESVSYKGETNNLLVGHTCFIDENYTGSFAGNTDLVDLLVLTGTMHIPSEAFSGCSALASADLPNSVQSIGSEAFLGCSLFSLVVPNSVQTIEDRAFKECSSLAAIILPKSLQSLGSEAFFGCTDLLSLVLPDSLEVVKEGTFKGCTSLAAFALPKFLKTMEKDVFSGCEALQTMVLPDTLQVIEEGTFRGCSSLSVIGWSKSLQSIGNEAFSECSALASLRLPASMQSIGSSAFADCSNLVEVDISKVALEATNSIDWNSAFNNQADLDRVTKVICRQEQADKMKSVFTNATLTYVD